MAELNFNAAHFIPMQPEEKMSDYAVWVELCQRMDCEVSEARLKWREAVLERNRVMGELKEKVDSLRLKCVELEARPKPPAPKKTKE